MWYLEGFEAVELVKSGLVGSRGRGDVVSAPVIPSAVCDLLLIGEDGLVQSRPADSFFPDGGCEGDATDEGLVAELWVSILRPDP